MLTTPRSHTEQVLIKAEQDTTQTRRGDHGSTDQYNKPAEPRQAGTCSTTHVRGGRTKGHTADNRNAGHKDTQGAPPPPPQKKDNKNKHRVKGT